MSYYDYLEKLPVTLDVMIQLIHYLNNAHAIPPLKGNKEWFDYSLAVLIELVNPNCAVRK